MDKIWGDVGNSLKKSLQKTESWIDHSPLFLAKETLLLRTFGKLKVPMLFGSQPSVKEFTNNRLVIQIPLTRFTRNHVHSMYFGALAVGADCAAGFCAIREAQKTGTKISLVFKNFKAEFKKRAEGDVDFVSDQVSEIRELVAKVAQSSERLHLPVFVKAYLSGSVKSAEPVAEFELTLSIKKQAKSSDSKVHR